MEKVYSTFYWIMVLTLLLIRWVYVFRIQASEINNIGYSRYLVYKNARGCLSIHIILTVKLKVVKIK